MDSMAILYVKSVHSSSHCRYVRIYKWRWKISILARTSSMRYSSYTAAVGDSCGVLLLAMFRFVLAYVQKISQTDGYEQKRTIKMEVDMSSERWMLKFPFVARQNRLSHQFVVYVWHFWTSMWVYLYTQAIYMYNECKIWRCKSASVAELATTGATMLNGETTYMCMYSHTYLYHCCLVIRTVRCLTCSISLHIYVVTKNYIHMYDLVHVFFEVFLDCIPTNHPSNLGNIHSHYPTVQLTP